MRSPVKLKRSWQEHRADAQAGLRASERIYQQGRVYYPHENVRGSFSMGKDNYMETGVRVDGSVDVSFGEHCFISHNVKILTHSHDRLKGRVANIHEVTGRKAYSIKIGNNVFISEDAVILPQAGEIGDDAVIGVRAVVTKPVGAGEIWAGNPARKVGSRYDEDTDGAK